jgi:phosphoglucosamine mutase
MLETALESGIASMGVDVYLAGPLPTPGIAFMTRSMRADAGIMISASHNSYEDNGIKFFGGDGFKLADGVENEIERLMTPGHLDELRAVPDLIGKAYRIDDAIGRYTVYLKSCVERTCAFDDLKVVLDTANGAAYKVAPMVYNELGAEVHVVNNQPDGKNINEGCGSLHPEGMCQAVREVGAHCGIAFDGDADRVIMCDENGEIFDGDHVLALLGTVMRDRGELTGGGVVGTVMSNLGLEVAFREQGLNLYRAGVGDRYVLAEMQARGINLGGEQSGHIIALDHNTTGDGILTSLLVTAALIRRNKPLSEYRSLMTLFPQRLINLKVAKKPPLEEVYELQKCISECEKELGSRGRVLVRYSGTEKLARVMVEADDAERCNNSAEKIAEVVQQELG